MMQSWKWTIRYTLVLLAAIALGAGIAELAVFKQTTLGTQKLSAAALARFLGYGGALAVFCMFGWRASRQLRVAQRGCEDAGILILPLTALIALSVAYDAVLGVLRSFLTPAGKDIYNWIFVAAITACAIWLVVALYRHAEGLIEMVRDALLRKHVERCAVCKAPVKSSARFCAGCGQDLRAGVPDPS
jgi:hypothetical protein